MSGRNIAIERRAGEGRSERLPQLPAELVQAQVSVAENRVAGAPPASWYIDDFMKAIGAPYYVGVLTAAALHGAAHQQPSNSRW